MHDSRMVLSHFIILFHSAIFHFFSVTVVLFAFAGERLSEGDADHGGARQRASYAGFEVVHIIRKEALANSPQRENFLFIGNYHFGYAKADGRLVF